MQQHWEEIRAHAGILGICAAPLPLLTQFVEDNPLPFPIVTDPSRQAYQSFGLNRTSWWTILRPDVVLRYLWLIFRGHAPKRVNSGEDVLQLGGDFVLDRTLTIIFAHASSEPTDRPKMAMLMEAIRRAPG